MQHRIVAWLAWAPIVCLAQTVTNVDAWDYAVPVQEQCYADGQGQLAANVCMKRAFNTREQELDRLYASLNASIEDSKDLGDSQRAWLKFRDAQCSVRVSGMNDVGSAYGFFVDSCRLDLTLKRIKDLKLIEANLDCGGCPVRKEK